MNSGVYSKGSLKKCYNVSWHIFRCDCRILNDMVVTYTVSYSNNNDYHRFSWPWNVSASVHQIFTPWLKIKFHFKNCQVFLAHLVPWSERKHHFLLPRYISNDPQITLKKSSEMTFLEIKKNHVITIEPCPCQLWNQPASSAMGTTYSLL